MSKEEKRPHTFALMALTAIITAGLTIGATLYIIDMEKPAEASQDQGASIEIELTEYGAYCKYTLKADTAGTVTASDGSAFMIDGQQVTEYKFQAGTHTLTLYGGATPKAIPETAGGSA